MSDYHTGTLAYGYHLGTADEHLVKETGKWGSLDLPWMEKDEDGFATETLIEAFSRRLFEATPDPEPSREDASDRENPIWDHFGVKVIEHGWLVEGDSPSYALIAHSIEVDGGDAELVNLPGLIKMQSRLSFNEKLEKALEVLGVTPKQAQPQWMLLATR